MFQYCPQCRSADSHVEDDKKFSCGNCSFVFYKNTAAAVAVLVETNQGYIVLKRGREPGRGLLDLPGGFVDPHETAEEACFREIREEIGKEIKNLTYLGSGHNIYPYKGVTYSTCDLFFKAECDTLDFIRQEDEIDEIILLQKDEIDIERFAFQSIKDFLKRTL